MGDDDREAGKGQIMMTLFTNLRNLNFTLKALGLLVKDLKNSSGIIRSITATMGRQLTDSQMSLCTFSAPCLESLESYLKYHLISVSCAFTTFFIILISHVCSYHQTINTGLDHVLPLYPQHSTQLIVSAQKRFIEMIDL